MRQFWFIIQDLFAGFSLLFDVGSLLVEVLFPVLFLFDEFLKEKKTALISTFSILIWIWSLKTTVVATVVNSIGLQTVATCLLDRGVRGPV